MADVVEIQQRFRDFAHTSHPRAPLYSTLATRIADDADIAGLLMAAPPTQRLPVLLFAATHHLVLEGRSSELAAHYPNLTAAPATTDPWPAFVALCNDHRERLRELVATRHTQTNEIGRCATFLPAFGLVADETATPLAQVDVGCSAGLTMRWFDYGYRYDLDTSGESGTRHILGEGAAVTLPCGVRGPAPLPRDVPAHVPGIGLDLIPVDVGDDEAVRWLEACVWPDQTDRFHRLESAVAAARNDPPELRRGDAVDDLADAVHTASERGHPIVTTSWALSYLTEQRQRQFVAALDELGAESDLSWVAAESPAQTPGLPIEPGADPHLTVLSLATWRGGERTVRRLATAHPHGYWLHWEG